MTLETFTYCIMAACASLLGWKAWLVAKLVWAYHKARRRG